MIDIEPLKIILSNSDDKDKIIKRYMDKTDIINKYIYNDNDNLFINTNICGVKKSTLKIDFIGKVISINREIITIKLNNIRNINVNKNEYYIFSKLKRYKKQMMENLLEIL